MARGKGQRKFFMPPSGKNQKKKPRIRSKDARDQTTIPGEVSIALDPSSSNPLEVEISSAGLSAEDENVLPPPTVNFDVQLNALPSLLMVDMQMDDVDQVVKALCTFAGNLLANRISKQNTELYAKEALILGGHTVVFLAMQKWESHEHLQRVGCSCILLLSRHMRNTIVAAGGIEGVIRAMKAHPESKMVQRSACAALSSLYVQFQRAPSSVAKRLHKFVTEQDGLELIVTAMKKFPLETDLQDICCRFLCNLSRSPVFCHVLRRTHAMSAVTASLEKHPDHKAILLCAQKLTAAILAK